MKSEYSLEVKVPINDAVKRVMQMPGSDDAETRYFRGRIKQISRSLYICLMQVSESEIAFQDTFAWTGVIPLTGDCIFKSVSKNRTRVTAKFRISSRHSGMSIRGRKIFTRIFLLLIPATAWFLNGFLLDKGVEESQSLKFTVIVSLILLLVPIYNAYVLWWTSGKIKIFLKNFSEALGVDNKWI